LPRKGFKTITITEKDHRDLKMRAEKASLTLREYVDNLFSKESVTKQEI
jgi:hypothetical protein